MADFDVAFPIVLRFEGGYVDNPNDPGGETNLGITMATFLRTAHPLLGIEPTSENLKALTPDQAGVIYKANYWTPVNAETYALQELANIVFDFYVNAGAHATSLLQRVLNSMGADPPLVVDGCVGPGTLAALAALPAEDVYNNYKQGRIAYYTALGQKYPMFLKGWLNRVNAFPDLPSSAGTGDGTFAVDDVQASIQADAAAEEAASLGGETTFDVIDQPKLKEEDGPERKSAPGGD